MIASSDYLAALLTNYQQQFGKTWNDRENVNVMLQLAQRIQSSTLTETIPFVGAGSTGPTDVTHGVVTFEDMKQYSYSLTNKTWASGFEIQREAFADDRYKMYADEPARLARTHQDHVARLIAQQFELGTATLAYDGIAFFANSRATGSTGQTNDNLLAATGTYTTSANIFTDLRAGQAAAMAFTNDKGQALGIRMNTIILPDDLYDQFYTGMTYNAYLDKPGEQLPPAGDSFQVGAYTVMLNRELTDAGDWYLAYVNPRTGAYPFVWTDREAPHLDGTTSTDSYEWRVLRKAQYTTYGRYNAGVANPLYCIKFA